MKIKLSLVGLSKGATHNNPILLTVMQPVVRVEQLLSPVVFAAFEVLQVCADCVCKAVEILIIAPWIGS